MNPEIFMHLPYKYRAFASQAIKRIRREDRATHFDYRFRAWVRAGAHGHMSGYRLHGGIGGVRENGWY